MYLISKIALAITKEKIVYDFLPNVKVEVPDHIGEIILENPYNQQFITKTDAPVKDEKVYPELKVVQDPPLPKSEVNEEEKKEEVKPLFTEEELLKMDKEELVELGKEMGITAVNIGWKEETIIRKILDVNPIPTIE